MLHNRLDGYAVVPCCAAAPAVVCSSPANLQLPSILYTVRLSRQSIYRKDDPYPHLYILCIHLPSTFILLTKVFILPCLAMSV